MRFKFITKPRYFCEHSFVIKLKHVKILDSIISISVFLLYFLKLSVGNGFKSVSCTLDARLHFIKMHFYIGTRESFKKNARNF